MRLIETLDDHDDVDAVHANFDIPEALLERPRPPPRWERPSGAAAGEASEARAQNEQP